MAVKSNKNIVRNIKHYHWNASYSIFILVAVYICVIVIAYFNQKHIRPYLVEGCTITNDKLYTGIILREETLVSADSSGYINYYVAEGERANAGALVYTIDETGEFSKLLSESLSENQETLNSDQWYDLKNRLYLLSTGYTDKGFSEVYTSKTKLNNKILEYFYDTAIENLNESLDTSGYMQYTIDHSAAILYHMDGYEDRTVASLNMDDFNKENYKSETVSGGSLVTTGQTVYKEVTADEWTLVFPITEDVTEDIVNPDASRIEIYIPSLDQTFTLPFSVETGSDGTMMGCISFTKYGTAFLEERFLQFQIVTNDIEGLKIPVNAVAEQDFFKIPKSYFFYNDERILGTLVVHPGEDELSPEFVSPVLYGLYDDYYYVSMSEFQVGDYLVSADTMERFYIAPTGTLTGVYNINQGFTRFRQINIITRVDDMYVISKNLSYGVNTYDHIAMNAESLTENELVK